jgi:hypothetical protein
MKRNQKRVLIAVLAICALAAGGAAFTASLGANFPSSVTAGFGQVTVNGAQSDGVNYNLSTDKQFVQSVDLYFTDDVTADTVQAAFGDSATNATNLITCGAVSQVSGGAHDGDYTTNCSFQVASAPYTAAGEPVTTASYFNVSVTKDGSHATINGS